MCFTGPNGSPHHPDSRKIPGDRLKIDEKVEEFWLGALCCESVREIAILGVLWGSGFHQKTDSATHKGRGQGDRKKCATKKDRVRGFGVGLAECAAVWGDNLEGSRFSEFGFQIWIRRFEIGDLSSEESEIRS